MFQHLVKESFIIGTCLTTVSKPSSPPGGLGNQNRAYLPASCGPPQIKQPQLHASARDGLGHPKRRRKYLRAGWNVGKFIAQKPACVKPLACSQSVCGLWKEERFNFYFFPSHVISTKIAVEHSASGSSSFPILKCEGKMCALLKITLNKDFSQGERGLVHLK